MKFFLTVLKNHPLIVPKFAALIVVAAILTSLVTYFTLTGSSFIELNQGVITNLVIVNSIFIFLLVFLILGQILLLYTQRRYNKQYAPKLQLRLLFLVSFVSIVPSVLVAFFAYNTMEKSLDSWFSETTKRIVRNAEKVAESYLREHSNNIRSESIAMAQDLGNEYFIMLSNPYRFKHILRTQLALRGLSAAYVFNKDKRLLSHFSHDKSYTFNPPKKSVLKLADQNNVVLVEPGKDNIVRALIKIGGFGPGFYLYVYRYLDPSVVEHLRKTRANIKEYQSLEINRDRAEFAFGFVFAGMALVLLLSALWFGIWFSKSLTKPIIDLTDAANIVANGQLNYKLAVEKDGGEIAELTHSFNIMTDKLETQHKELIYANEQLDGRNEFIENVLAGISTGIISVNKNGVVNFVNSAAEKILNITKKDAYDINLIDILPDIAPLIKELNGKNKKAVQKQIELPKDSEQTVLNISITSLQSEEKDKEFIVTMEDISELLMAQRNSAWSDVARRIAHEIKNPLTPIQLSTERLKRKYETIIKEKDRQLFNQCTDTIIRQVSDIGRMVEEFSNFSRMPQAQINHNDVIAIITETVEFERLRNTEIKYLFNLTDKNVFIDCDKRLMSQALINVLKNAVEAIEISKNKNQGKIIVSISKGNEYIEIIVDDNGVGLPKEGTSNLTEPYVTNREKGTGLGLAIVKKIMEQHEGSIRFEKPLKKENSHKMSTRVVLKWLVSHEKNVRNQAKVFTE